MGEGHPLEHAYTISIFKRPQEPIDTYHDYMKHVKVLATVKTVEEFWEVYSHLIRVDQLFESFGRCNVHVFKEGIDPVWEVPENRNGGQFTIRCRSETAPRIWENILLAMLGEQFHVGEEITGAVCTISKRDSFNIAVWNGHKDQEGLKSRIRASIYRFTNLPTKVNLEYKAHFDG